MNLLDLMVTIGVNDKASSKIDSVASGVKGKLGSAAVAAGNLMSDALTGAMNAVGASMDAAVSRVDTLNQFPKVMQQMGFSAESAQGSIDKLSAGIDGLPTALDTIASSAQNIALLTGDLDGATDTALALNDAFLASGSSAADAERGMTQYTQMLSKGTVDMESWRTLQETMGYALRETANAMGYEGEAAVNDLYDALKSGDVTFDEFNAKLVELDGSVGGFRETAGTASAGIQTSMDNAKTAVVKNLANIIDAINSSGAITGFFDGLKGAINEAGKAVEPFATALGEWLGGVPDMLGEISAQIEGSGLTDAAEGVFGTIGDTIDGVSEAMDGLSEAWGPTFTDALEHAAQVLESVNSFFDGFRQALEEWVIPDVEDLGPKVSDLFTAFSSLLDALEPLTSFLGGAFGFVIAIVIELLGGLINIVTQVANAITGFINFISGVPEAVGSFIQGVIDWFAALPGEVQAKFDEIVQSVQEWVSQVGTDIGTFFQELPGNILAAIGDVGNLLFSVGETIINSLWDGLKSIWNNVTGWFSDITSAIPQIKGPYERDRKLLTRNGQAIMQGLADGLADGWGDVEGQLGGYTAGIEASISPKVSGASVPASSAAVIGWLADNLPSIIAECTPVMGQRDFGRAARRAAVYA